MTNKRMLLGVALVVTTMAAALYGQNPSDSADHQHDGQTVEGSWIDTARGQDPGLFTFIEGGGVIATRPITVSTPFGFELVSSGHGTWARTGSNEFSTTELFLRSGPNVEFTGIVKVNRKLRLTDSDELTGTATVNVFDANGNLLFSFPLPILMKRIAVEP
jgi:hypothetical protein